MNHTCESFKNCQSHEWYISLYLVYFFGVHFMIYLLYLSEQNSEKWKQQPESYCSDDCNGGRTRTCTSFSCVIRKSLRLNKSFTRLDLGKGIIWNNIFIGIFCYLLFGFFGWWWVTCLPECFHIETRHHRVSQKKQSNKKYPCSSDTRHNWPPYHQPIHPKIL